MAKNPVKTTSVHLTDEQLLILDQKCDSKIQTEIDNAKARIKAVKKYPNLEPHLAKLLADILVHAKKEQKLIFRDTTTHHCAVCQRGKGFFARKEDRPLLAIELEHSFVTIKNHISVGGCRKCVMAIIEPLKKELAKLKVELPEQLAGPVTYKRYEKVRCTKCRWNGHEGEMGLKPTFFGDGTYRATCPNCHSENSFGVGPIIRNKKEYVVVKEKAISANAGQMAINR